MDIGASDPESFGWFVGIDWGTANHTIDVGDAAGHPVSEQVVEHSSVALARFADWLVELTGGHLERVAVAIETPRGAVVETLLERGAAVFSINPKQLDRFRDRFSVAGAKDDRLDALVLRSALRTDHERFRRLSIDEPLIIRIRELTRADAVLLDESMALTNRLRELVHRITPEWLTLSTNADDPWFWSLLELTARARPGRAKIQSMLRSHRIRRVDADDVLKLVRQPRLTLAPGTREAVTAHIQLLLPRVRLVHEQRQQCERELKAVIAELARTGNPLPPTGDGDGSRDTADASAAPPGDITIMQSTPGIGIQVTAALLADASAQLRLRDYDGLRTITGVAPVRRQTGKNTRGLISMRYACNMRLRNACYHWARVSTRVDETARRYYADLRARGHSHGRALRSVADRWLRILIAMLRTRTVYDPTRFSLASAGAVPLAPTP